MALILFGAGCQKNPLFSTLNTQWAALCSSLKRRSRHASLCSASHLSTPTTSYKELAASSSSSTRMLNLFLSRTQLQLSQDARCLLVSTHTNTGS